MKLTAGFYLKGLCAHANIEGSPSPSRLTFHDEDPPTYLHTNVPKGTHIFPWPTLDTDKQFTHSLFSGSFLSSLRSFSTCGAVILPVDQQVATTKRQLNDAG
jgi:hypothetical protein